MLSPGKHAFRDARCVNEWLLNFSCEKIKILLIPDHNKYIRRIHHLQPLRGHCVFDLCCAGRTAVITQKKKINAILAACLSALSINQAGAHHQALWEKFISFIVNFQLPPAQINERLSYRRISRSRQKLFFQSGDVTEKRSLIIFNSKQPLSVKSRIHVSSGVDAVIRWPPRVKDWCWLCPAGSSVVLWSWAVCVCAVKQVEGQRREGWRLTGQSQFFFSSKKKKGNKWREGGKKRQTWLLVQSSRQKGVGNYGY